MDRALGRVLTERPSDLARGLIGDMCQRELDCPCCPGNVMALWRRQLPDHVRAGIARRTLTKDTYEETLELADDIFASRSAGNPTVAAVTSLDETQPAIPFPVPEVAAIRGRGRGGRGGRGGYRGGRGRGGGSAQAPQQSSQGGTRQYKGPKHPDLPQGQWTGCQMHHRWGKSAFFCSEPSTCPWKDIFISKPQK